MWAGMETISAEVLGGSFDQAELPAEKRGGMPKDMFPGSRPGMEAGDCASSPVPTALLETSIPIPAQQCFGCSEKYHSGRG